MQKIMIVSLIFSIPMAYAMHRPLRIYNPSLTEVQKKELETYENINCVDPEAQTEENKLLRAYVNECIARDVNKLDATIIGHLSGPLHIAAQSDHNAAILQRCAINMLAHQIPTNRCDVAGKSALMIACDHRAVKNTQILAEFCGKTENLNDADNEYRTALHHVYSPILDSFDSEKISRRFACAKILLESGANPNVLDHNDMTPLCYVATSYFGNFTNTPATNSLSTCEYERFISQRKALISLLIRHKANKGYSLKTIETKLKNDPSQDYLQEFKHHLELPSQNHDCNLH